MVLRNLCLYNEFMSKLNEKKHQHREYVENRINELKNSRTKLIVDSCEVYIPKHTAEELQWRKDEVRCKQKLDLILNSGVDLMKFGYNAKLCRMFPELTKGIILFLLRKYNIPHFERKGSKELS